jgi:predicted nuclease with RNAse H fold
MSRATFVLGVDPAFPGHGVAFALLDEDARLLRLGRKEGYVDLLSLAQELAAEVIAIDAPLGLPAGWGCLDFPCTCGRCQRGPSARRAAERALARLGIGVMWTTKRTILRPLVEWAMAQRQALERAGKKVIEVYPYASKVALLGRPPAKKTTAAGRQWLQAGLSRWVHGLAPDRLLSHDELDAVVAAYTAILWRHGQACALGEEEDGVIVVARPILSR